MSYLRRGKWSFIYYANLHTSPSPWGPFVMLVLVLGTAGVTFLDRNYAVEAEGHGGTLEVIMQKTFYRAFFRVSSLLTDRFPHFGGQSLNAIIFCLIGNRFFVSNGLKKVLARLKRIGHFSTLLIIGDLNIGDAVNLQSGISALRVFFLTLKSIM